MAWQWAPFKPYLSLLIFSCLYLMVNVLIEWRDGGLSLLSPVTTLQFKANFSRVHSDAHKLALEQKAEEDSVSSIKILCPKAVFRIGLKSMAMQVLGKRWHLSGMTACAFYKSIITLGWLELTESYQVETWEAQNRRCVYLSGENNGKIQLERAGLGGPDSRLSSAALSRAAWGKLFNIS